MRTDTHRPSAINPHEYDFVAFDYLKVSDLGSALFMQEQRKMLRAHMEMTGGKWSNHEHGGNCHICGSVNAIYTAAFFHKPSGKYIKTGLDCAEKLECEGIEAFRKKVGNALEANKGKRKAKAVLENAGQGGAWAIYEADVAKAAAYKAACEVWRAANPDPVMVSDASGYGMIEVGAPKWVEASKDEATVLDIVARLIKWGSVSDKALNYLGVLVERVAKAPEIAAARAAEAADAKPIPAFKGRVAVKGKVLTVKQPDQDAAYPSLKMLIQHADGWKVWGTVPSNIAAEIARGDEVELVASVKVSDRDPKFGFISRPAQAKLVKEAA